MQNNPQRELFTSLDANTSTRLVNLDNWCTAANDDSAQCFLKTTLQSMVSGNARELHIEQEADLCRIRLRINGRLTEQKIHNPAFANEVLHIIGRDNQRSTQTMSANDDFGKLNIPVQIDGEKVDLNICHYSAASGKCLTLSVNAARAIPEVLEQTRMDASAKREIRQLYNSTAQSGITLICSQTDDLLRSVLHALLGEVNNVERKIVSLQHRIDKEIPRVSQILANISDSTTQPASAGELKTMISAAAHLSDHTFVDWVNCRNKDVISALEPNAAITLLWHGDVSTGLIELFERNILCSSLHTIIELADAGLICPHCADDYKLNKFDFERLPDAATNEATESYFFANGCKCCHDTGVSVLHTVTSIAKGTDAIRKAVRNRSLQATQEAVASTQGTTAIASQMERLARTGKISFEDWINQL